MKKLLAKIIRLFKRERYFIITIQWEMSKGRAGYGELSHISLNYPSRDALIAGIKEQRKTVEKVIILYIREMKKKDYFSYVKSNVKP